MTDFHGDQAKKIIQNGRLKKSAIFKIANSQNFFVKISWIGQKQPKNTKNAFFACFWAYVGQSLNHIGWTTSMPFTSINPTNPRTNPWNFWKKILRIGGIEKLSFLSQPFDFFFKSVQIYRVDWMGQNFDVFLAMRNITLYSVCLANLFDCFLSLIWFEKIHFRKRRCIMLRMFHQKLFHLIV